MRQMSTKKEILKKSYVKCYVREKARANRMKCSSEQLLHDPMCKLERQL